MKERGGGHRVPKAHDGGDKNVAPIGREIFKEPTSGSLRHLGRYAKVWNSAVFARKFEALASKAEFTAAEKKVTYIANFNGRLERRLRGESFSVEQKRGLKLGSSKQVARSRRARHGTSRADAPSAHRRARHGSPSPNKKEQPKRTVPQYVFTYLPLQGLPAPQGHMPLRSSSEA